jgi:undecaprenyl-diphosphatase
MEKASVLCYVMNNMKKIDQHFFLFLNGHHTDACDKVAYWVSHPFFWVPLYIFLIYLLIRVLQKKTWIILLLIAILITLGDQFSSTLVKPWVQRLRPCEDPDIQHCVRVVGHYVGRHGFISSHATNTFALAMLLWLLLRAHYKFIFFLFFWAAGVSYARVYGGVHYPGDVAVGALAGILLAWLMYKFYLYLLASSKL